MIAILFCVHLLHRYKAKIIDKRTLNQKGIQNNLHLCSKKFWHDEIFIFFNNFFFNAIYLVVFRNVRRIPWAFMSCSVKSSTTFHTRTACMSGSTSLPHVGHTSHVKHRDCRCLILLNIISKAFNRWGQFKPDKKSCQMHFLYQVVPSF